MESLMLVAFSRIKLTVDYVDFLPSNFAIYLPFFVYYFLLIYVSKRLRVFDFFLKKCKKNNIFSLYSVTISNVARG